MPDCGFCHTAVEPVASLATLIPGGRLTLVVVPVDGVGPVLERAELTVWRTALTSALEAQDVEVVARGGPGAPTLTVEIRRIEGTGRTAAGPPFSAVRYDAVLRIGRASVAVRGTPFVARAAPPRDDARGELIRRIAPIVAY